jgi:serine/threonine-protein kinase
MRVILLFTAIAACGPTSPAHHDMDPVADARDVVADTGAVGGDGTAGTDAPPGSPAVGPYFTQPMFWNTDVSAAAKSSSSDSIITALRSEGGWGNSDRMQVDFDIDLLTADAATPHRSFTPSSDWFSPDCDTDPMPVPVGGNVEGETGYACTGGGDCHLIVVDQSAGKLYEMWRADITSATTFNGGCLAVWGLGTAYGSSLRGEQCSSADAAGYPITPLLFTADEVAAGHIDHAIRLILPNNRVKRGYTRPATHASSTTGIATAPPYGVHMRLRANYPIDSLPSEGAKVVARAMQKYGMYHADGGNIALTARSDRHTTAKWAGLLDAHDLAALRVEDFEVIDHGTMIPLTYDCTRN